MQSAKPRLGAPNILYPIEILHDTVTYGESPAVYTIAAWQPTSASQAPESLIITVCVTLRPEQLQLYVSIAHSPPTLAGNTHVYTHTSPLLVPGVQHTD